MFIVLLPSLQYLIMFYEMRFKILVSTNGLPRIFD